MCKEKEAQEQADKLKEQSQAIVQQTPLGVEQTVSTMTPLTSSPSVLVLTLSSTTNPPMFDPSQ